MLFIIVTCIMKGIIDRNNLCIGMKKKVWIVKRIYNWVCYTTLIISFTDSILFVKYIVKNYLVLDYKSKILVEIIIKSQSVWRIPISIHDFGSV